MARLLLVLFRKLLIIFLFNAYDVQYISQKGHYVGYQKCYMTNVKLTLFLFLVNFFRPKRQAKPTADDGFWDCSVCTFRNSAEAFKCSICDVRKGTSTRYGSIDFESAKGFMCASYSTESPYRLSFSCSKPPCTRY